MVASWRSPLVALLALALLSAGAAAQAPDGPLGPADLEELEGLLQELGFDPGPVDGVVDADTTEAIRRYHDFALLTGEPAPSGRLLDELRGVAAAFAALNAGKAQSTAATPDAPPAPAPLLEKTPEKAPEKTIVPPPPPPAKLTAPEAAPEQAPEEAPEKAAEPAEQMAALPPPTAMPQPQPEEADSAEPEAEADPAVALQARIDAELLRFHHLLQGGSLTREELARQFNSEGRALLQQAQYDEAILKFSVAVHLDPGFAGAYANRGTAWRHQKESALAKADFDKAKELGFASFRKKGKSNPLD